jgi:hypothetical protein
VVVDATSSSVPVTAGPDDDAISNVTPRLGSIAGAIHGDHVEPVDSYGTDRRARDERPPVEQHRLRRGMLLDDLDHWHELGLGALAVGDAEHRDARRGEIDDDLRDAGGLLVAGAVVGARLQRVRALVDGAQPSELRDVVVPFEPDRPSLQGHDDRRPAPRRVRCQRGDRARAP